MYMLCYLCTTVDFGVPTIPNPKRLLYTMVCLSGQ